MPSNKTKYIIESNRFVVAEAWQEAGSATSLEGARAGMATMREEYPPNVSWRIIRVLDEMEPREGNGAN